MATITGTPPGDNFGSSPQLPERYVLGLRRCEVRDLHLWSIDWEKGVLTIPSRKNRTTRQVTISPELHEILSAYVRAQTHARLATMKRLARLRQLRRKK